jgi:hypothetical protein
VAEAGLVADFEPNPAADEKAGGGGDDGLGGNSAADTNDIGVAMLRE